MKRSLLTPGVMAALVWFSQSLIAAPAPPAKLEARPVENPLELPLNEYAFSWSAEGDWYELLVASTASKLAADVGDLWMSGRRPGKATDGGRATYLGRALAEGTSFWWKVRTGSGENPPSAWSPGQRVEVPVRTLAPEVGEELRHRVVLLGGTLISRMEKYGHLETALTARWPQHDLSFRNLGWPGDDVFGTARSEFGSAHNTRSWQPPQGEEGFGFETLQRQLAEAQPTTLIVGYGAEAAFADSEAKMARFEAGYRALIEALERTEATLVLLSPVLQVPHERVLPEVEARNARLTQAGRFIMNLARERKHRGVDLIQGDPFAGSEGVTLYDNGVHLNDAGYRRLALAFCESIGIEIGHPGHSERSLAVKSGTGAVEDLEQTRLGVRYDFARDRLPTLSQESVDVEVEGAQARVWVDGEEVLVKGGEIRSGPDFAQAEALRRVIIEKNQLYRYKINPINKAYIFLFRRHEMGHLAYELEDLEEWVRGKEQAIAKLRVPRAHRYEVETPREWKAPRDYPDHEVPKNIPEPDVAAELRAFDVADGFEVNLWAKNPAIFNPINLNWDRHGRAWVATSSTYPHIKPGRLPNDRIVILEDRDGDGVSDWHTVFAEGLTVPHSVMPVEGGAYVCTTTELLFLSDADGDDRADDRRVIFSGFGNADVHHMIHGLRWSPWGDLFFTQSIYINSFVETVHGPRRLNGSGVWQFRPEIERIEVFSRGRVNPWGFAFDDFGNSFGTDGAGGKGPHDVFPGSAYGTAAGAPRVLDGLIPGKPKNTAAEFMSGRHLPESWLGTLLANDFRANRTVRYALEENGSGFNASEVETVLRSSHRSYRPVDIKMGPDGAVYIVDWYNPIIDHGEVDFHHPLRDRSHGRIWRVTAKGRPLVDRPDIAGATLDALLDYLTVPEQYTRTQANRELVRRRVSRSAIQAWLERQDPADPAMDRLALEALWLATALNLEPEGLETRPLQSSDPRIRAAAVRVVGRSERGMAPLELAVKDTHPRVRLEAINALRQLATLEAAEVALRALDDEVDQNLDFALEMTVRDTRDAWLPAMQRGERVFGGNASHLSYALGKANDTRAVDALAQLIANEGVRGEALLNAVTMVASLGSREQVSALLTRAEENQGWLPFIAQGAAFNEAVPGGKEKVRGFLSSPEPAVRVAAAVLCGAWEIESAGEVLVRMAEASESEEEVMAATRALAEVGLNGLLEGLIRERHPLPVRMAAVSAAAQRDPVAYANRAAALLSALPEPEGVRSLVNAFLGRAEGPDLLARALADQALGSEVALEASRVASASGRDVPGLLAALNEAGGLKPVATELSSEQRRQLIDDARAHGSIRRGRQIYQRAALACTNCHLVAGEGGKLGPDLSTVGTYMTPESLLESLLNPSSDIKQGYETVVVTTQDQTLISGLLQRKTDKAVLVRDPSGEVVSVPSGEVAKIDTSPASLMPPGLTASLRRDELVDLLHYLTALGKEK